MCSGYLCALLMEILSVGGPGTPTPGFKFSITKTAPAVLCQASPHSIVVCSHSICGCQVSAESKLPSLRHGTCPLMPLPCFFSACDHLSVSWNFNQDAAGSTCLPLTRTYGSTLVCLFVTGLYRTVLVSYSDNVSSICGINEPDAQPLTTG